MTSVSPAHQVSIAPVTPSTPVSQSQDDGMDKDELEAVISVAEQMTADLQQTAEEPIPNVHTIEVWWVHCSKKTVHSTGSVDCVTGDKSGLLVSKLL